MDLFNKIHDMKGENLWILCELAWNDPNVSEKYKAAAAAG